jgi:hypothetical protein
MNFGVNIYSKNKEKITSCDLAASRQDEALEGSEE